MNGWYVTDNFPRNVVDGIVIVQIKEREEGTLKGVYMTYLQSKMKYNINQMS